MLTTPAQIAPLLKEKTIENIFFKKFLRKFSSTIVDAKIHELSEAISLKIDCMSCANCCKKLEPGLEPDEMETLAKLKQQEVDIFKQNFIAFDGNAHYLQTKPCMFLSGNVCSIYENRPGACSSYPHLNQTDMKHRRTLWENYSICPIVFNTIEHLKIDLAFNN